jgi:hypothetical protein
LLSPDFWVHAAALLAVGGLICVAAGLLIGNHGLVIAGEWMSVPIIVGAVLLTIIVIPLLIAANHKHKRQ